MKTSMRMVIVGVLTAAVLGAVLAASARDIAVLPDEPKRVVVDARDPQTEPQDNLPSVKIEQPVSSEPSKTAPSGAPQHSTTQVQTEIHRTPVAAPDLPAKSDEDKPASDAKSAHTARQPAQSTSPDESVTTSVPDRENTTSAKSAHTARQPAQSTSPDESVTTSVPDSENTTSTQEKNTVELPFVPVE